MNAVITIPADAILLAGISSDGTTAAYYKDFRGALLKFYVDLLKAAHPKDRFIILADGRTYSELEAAGIGQNNLMHCDLPDIWCRDVCPVMTPFNTVQFKYRPPLVEEEDVKYIAEKYLDFFKKAGISAQPLPMAGGKGEFTMDGGNYCHNGLDCAVVTRRAAWVNRMTREELVESLRPLTGSRRTAVIPEEPGDILGHADGMVSWLGQKCLAINRYDKPYQRRLMEELMTALREVLPEPEFKIEELPYEPTTDTWNGYQDATGVYTNILHTANAAYVPKFGLPQDVEAVETVRVNLDGGREAIGVSLGKVSKMGGALRCLTWQNRVKQRGIPL